MSRISINDLTVVERRKERLKSWLMVSKKQFGFIVLSNLPIRSKFADVQNGNRY